MGMDLEENLSVIIQNTSQLIKTLTDSLNSEVMIACNLEVGGLGGGDGYLSLSVVSKVCDLEMVLW